MLLLMALTMILTSSSFYKPGTLKDEKRLRSPLEPPSQKDVAPHFWKITDDILLYIFQSGEGQPVLVIHGGPGFPPSNSWEGVERLKPKYRFIYYHQRGCGKSTRPVDTFDSDNYLKNMVDLRDELKKIQAPVLVIHGEKDVMPSPASREYADLLSEGRLAIIPEAAHFPFLETPARFVEWVGEFLSKL